MHGHVIEGCRPDHFEPPKPHLDDVIVARRTIEVGGPQDSHFVPFDQFDRCNRIKYTGVEGLAVQRGTGIPMLCIIRNSVC